MAGLKRKAILPKTIEQRGNTMARGKKKIESAFNNGTSFTIESLDALDNWQETQKKKELSTWGFVKPLGSVELAAENVLDKLCQGVLPVGQLEKIFGDQFDVMKTLINSGAAHAGMVINWTASHPEYAGDFASIRTPKKREPK